MSEVQEQPQPQLPGRDVHEQQAAPERAPPQPPAMRGDFNFGAVVVGLPGWGKTTLMRGLIRRHLEDTRGIVIAHDPMQQFTSDGCVWYASADAWRQAAAAAGRAKQPMPRGASIGGSSSDDITRLVLDLGERVNSAKSTPLPILYPSDEGSLRSASGSSFISPLDNELMATRRHRGVGPVFNLQTATQLTARFYSLCTDVYMFRQTSDRAAKLEELLYLEPGELVAAGVVELEKYTYLHVRIGEGLVDD